MTRKRLTPPIQLSHPRRPRTLPSLPTSSCLSLIITATLLLELVVTLLRPTTTVATLSAPSSKLWGPQSRPWSLHAARGGGVGSSKSSSSPPPAHPTPARQRKEEENEAHFFFTIGERFQSMVTHECHLEEADVEDQQEEEGEEEEKKQATWRTQGIQSFAEEEELYTALQYGVVAIVGPQASGKSTLLNALFGTRFPVLNVRDAGAGRRTTRGVWVDLGSEKGSSCNSASSSSSPTATLSSACQSQRPLVVLDTEGLESVARGEGSDLFDRQLSALAVTAADVIILNVWARDIRGGRMGGELHASLLQTLIERTTTVTTRSSMKGSKKSTTTKKEGGKAEEGGLDVRVVAMPSREFQPSAFEEAVQELRRTLLLFDRESSANATGIGRAELSTIKTKKPSSWSEAPTQLFQPVPLSEFPAFAAELWASIIQESAGGMVGDSPASLPSPSKRGTDEKEIQAFIRRKVVESIVQEAEKRIERLGHKVEAAASEMPILEYGRDADSIITSSLKSLSVRLPPSAAAAAAAATTAESDVIAALTRRLAPSFRQHLDALNEYYFAKFQDRFTGLFLPVRALDKEATSITKDVSTAFQKAAEAAVPASVGRRKGRRQGWEWEWALERLKDEMDLEVADRRMEVEVLFPGEEELEMGRSRFLRKSWWKKVVLKAAVLYVNYLQTVHAAQGMARAAKRRQEKYPPIPMF
ncbi:gtp binding protein sey1 [Nannochloropsis oceanica]